MPVIKVWCLPAGQTEEQLNHLHQEIVRAVVSISELGIKDENDMTCLFVPDLMSYGLGEEVIVEVCGLYDKPERTKTVKQELAKSIGRAVKNLYPKAKVECFILTFDPKQGFWVSD
jgi:phenylpyruvate tautomerase PptA (4-oxalocrotonate tautomerase family)